MGQCRREYLSLVSPSWCVLENESVVTVIRNCGVGERERRKEEGKVGEKKSEFCFKFLLMIDFEEIWGYIKLRLSLLHLNLYLCALLLRCQCVK